MTSTNSPRTYPKILFVATVDQFLRIVLTHMDICRAAGWQVDIACRLTQFEDEMRLHCDHLYEVPFARSPLQPTNITATAKLIKIMREGQYDLVHSHTPAGGMAGRFAATKAGVPVRMYTAHGFHFHPEGERVSNTIFKKLEAHAGQNWSDLVQVVNSVDYNAALEHNIVPKEKLLLVPGTGVDTSRFDRSAVSQEKTDRLSTKYGLPADGPVLGMVAELIPRKRPQDAIMVLKLLKPEYPNAVLLLLGAGPLLPELKALAIKEGVEDSVRFLGFQRNTPEHLALMDVFLFTTRQEGFPVALMESMSMGVASVATNVRGNNDLIEHGRTGLLCPVADPAAMAGQCRLLLAGDEWRRAIGNAARSQIVEHYESTKVVGRQFQIYCDALCDAKKEGKVSAEMVIERQFSLGD